MMQRNATPTERTVRRRPTSRGRGADQVVVAPLDRQSHDRALFLSRDLAHVGAEEGAHAGNPCHHLLFQRWPLPDVMDASRFVELGDRLGPQRSSVLGEARKKDEPGSLPSLP
ncbi:hypothetical protein [Streptomyces mirabilis]|uniref:hypothetical protein n=1 Tax=Streptomyces mirabilis TaxID=68239 RepID=UPI00369B71CB